MGVPTRQLGEQTRETKGAEPNDLGADLISDKASLANLISVPHPSGVDVTGDSLAKLVKVAQNLNRVEEASAALASSLAELGDDFSVDVSVQSKGILRSRSKGINSNEQTSTSATVGNTDASTVPVELLAHIHKLRGRRPRPVAEGNIIRNLEAIPEGVESHSVDESVDQNAEMGPTTSDRQGEAVVTDATAEPERDSLVDLIEENEAMYGFALTDAGINKLHVLQAELEYMRWNYQENARGRLGMPSRGE